MNAKNIFISLVLLVGLIVLTSPAAFAQTTVYVDNTPGMGNDFNNGLSPSTPKATIGSALSEFPSGTIVSVKGTGLTYNETVTLGAGVNEKEYTIGTYDATAPIITALVVNLTAVAAPYENKVTFTGPFVVNNGVTLTAGSAIGAGNLTVKTSIIITEGTVDAAVIYSGNVNVTYNGANDRTTGGELGDAATTPQHVTLALTVAKTITLNTSKTFIGTLTTNANSTLALGGNILTLNDNVAHVNGGNITASSAGGIIVDGTDGNMSFTGNGELPNVTIQNGNTLTISNSVSIGSLTANSGGSIILSAVGAATIDNAKGTGKVINTSSGTINYTGAGGLTVKGDVEQSGTSTTATQARITFNGGVVNVKGNVINSAVPALSGTTATPNNIANIVFNDVAHIIEGSVQITGSGSITTTTGAITNIKTIEFNTTTNVTRIDAGISNSAALTLSSTTPATEIKKSGSVLFNARTTGNIGTVAAGQKVAISNTSSITAGYDLAASQNGAIDLNAAATGSLIGTNVTTTGASGGYINLGAGVLDISGDVTNGRSTANGVIAAPSGGVLVTIGGKLSNTGASNITLGGGAAVTVAGNLENTGSGKITINITGFGFSVTGLTTISSGTVELPLAVNATTCAFTGGLTLTGGTLDISGGGAITGVVSSGSLTLTGGTLKVGTGVRVWSSSAITHTIGGAAGNTTITPNDNTNQTAFTIITPAYAQVQTITFGPSVPMIPGHLTINVGTALPIPVILQGGNARVLGNVTFQAGVVQIDASKLIIGQSLNAPIGNGTFTNTAGYTTVNNGAVSLNGGSGPATQGIIGNGGATYQYGSLEIDNNPGIASAATPANPITLQGNLYLTRGVLDNTANNITFNNSVTVPTIVVNAGSLAVAPLYGAGTTVNITYIGIDKAASVEMEAGVTGKLNNLTIATTDGSFLAGHGTVDLDGTVLTGTTVTVSGTLTINAGQALLLNSADLVLAGESLVNNGLLTNVAAGDQLQFGRSAGTTITGNGWLPDIAVNANSSGNVINGSRGLVTGYLGADDKQGGAADFDPTTTAATGSLTFANGTAGLQVIFGTGALNGTNLTNITTANSGNTLKISSNLVEAGNATHVAGTIQIDSAFTLKHRGAAPSFTGGALTTGLGTLMFTGNAATPVIFSANTADVTIASKVDVNLTNTADIFELNNATAGHLIIAGDLTVTKGVVQLGSAVTARNLTLTGSKLTLTSTGSINTTGIGTLRLNAATPPLEWAFTGAVTVGNVRVSNDVTLSGSSTPSLTVTGLFTHDGGTLDFGDMNLTVSGGFARTTAAGGYSAGSGYLIVRNAAFNQSTGFEIPNLRFGTNPDALGLTFAGTGNVTVTKKLYLDNATGSTITHTVSGSPKLAVSDAADVYYSEGKFDVAPVYGATINLHVVNTAGAARVVDATVWPEVAGLVQQLEINNGGFGAVLPGARTVNTELLLTSGLLDMSAAAQVLTIVDASTINVIAGILTTTGGSVVYGNMNNVNYKINAAYSANKELPSTVNNLTITRNTNVANSAVTINHSVTVNGELAIKNNLTIPAAPPTVIVTANGNVSIVNDVANFSNATNPLTNFVQSMVFGGGNATLTVPDVTPPLNIGTISINKTANTNTLTLTGGNVQTGTITFVQGDIVTGDNVLYIPAPTQGAVAGGAVSQGFTGAGANSMVVGNVAKLLVNSGALAGSTEATNIFPVGTGNVYRPMSLTFNPNYGVPTTPNATIVVGHVDSSPGGDQALPIINGVETGVDISRYPSFYWSVYTVGSVSPSAVFDLGLTGGNFTDFDSPANVRIIRRHGAVGDINNDWLLQGSNENYDNEVNVETGFTAINRNSVAGLRTGGAVFTYGLKSNIIAATLEDVIIRKVGTSYPVYKLALEGVFSNYVGSLTYTTSSTNTAVATGVISQDTLIVTALMDGDAEIKIKAMDENNDFTTASLNVNATSVDVIEIEMPKEFSLKQNYPNPFNPITNISFDIPQNSSVKIVIYDMLGREVATLVNTNYAPGRYTVPFNASRLSSGMYIYRMTSQPVNGEMFTSIKKLMLLK